MMNPFEFKHAITGQPYRFARRAVGPIGEDTNNQDLLTLAVGAGYTYLANIITPLMLIDAGYKGLPMHTATIYGKYPWDTMYEYTTKASKATRLGTKYGGKVGGKLAGRLIPGVGWAMVAYDVYDVAVNRSLWGFDL